MRDTSLEAYEKLTQVNQKQKLVLDAIKFLTPCTDQEIAQRLGWPINRVTPRRGELEKMKLIESHGKTKTSSGRSAHTWRPTVRDPQQLALF
jgi:predicted ArsR family transcriptional regulator